jgi:hypothetical protein
MVDSISIKIVDARVRVFLCGHTLQGFLEQENVR